MREKRAINFDDSLLVSPSSILVSALIKRLIVSPIISLLFLRYQTQPALKRFPVVVGAGALIETH